MMFFPVPPAMDLQIMFFVEALALFIEGLPLYKLRRVWPRVQGIQHSIIINQS
jgi:hypothetical protein